MAVTKILARKGNPANGIRYILNGEKTQSQILTVRLNCDPGWEARQMRDTKEATGKTGGVGYYHMILSFKPGEITPEDALEIAKEFAEEQLPGFETVISVHTDKNHVHCHLIWNSVNADTGKKYHSNAKTYYSQVRAAVDRLCRKHGLSIVLTEEQDGNRTAGDEWEQDADFDGGQAGKARAMSYIEWLRQFRGQPTFRSMLEADLRAAIEEAHSLGEFFSIMENLGYEIKYGNRLGFRLRGQERFMIPGRRNALFTEDGILAAIQGNLEEIEAGLRPARPYRPPWKPYQKRQKYTGFLALYVHYLYILGKIEKRQFPPRMSPKLRKDLMRFEKLKTHAAFLRENDIKTQDDMSAYIFNAEDELAKLIKQRTILNVRKKRRRKLYAALADVSALAEAKKLYTEGKESLKDEAARYDAAVSTLEKCGISREALSAEKSEIYEEVARINRQIRGKRKTLDMCREIQAQMSRMEREIRAVVPESRSGRTDRNQER